MTTTNQDKRTLRSLLAGCSWVFDHPWLSDIAAHAPSATAADHHVTRNLGLPAPIGRALRDAVRLREQHPDTWQQIRETDRRPAEAVCGTDSLLWPWTLAVAAQLQTARWFGDTSIDVSSYPVLLRELSLPGSSWSSFDNQSEYYPAELKFTNGKWETFPRALYERTYLVRQGDRWTLCPRGGQDSWSFDLRFELLHARSLTSSGIPRFWKVVQLERPGGGKPYSYERIRLVVTEDTADLPHLSGHLGYEYILPYARYREEYLALIASADFSINGLADPSWTARFINPLHFDAPLSPAIRQGTAGFGSSIRSFSVTEATALLAPILERLTQAKPTLDLHTIVGQPLFDQQPAQLIDLVA